MKIERIGSTIKRLAYDACGISAFKSACQQEPNPSINTQPEGTPAEAMLSEIFLPTTFRLHRTPNIEPSAF